MNKTNTRRSYTNKREEKTKKGPLEELYELHPVKSRFRNVAAIDGIAAWSPELGVHKDILAYGLSELPT